MNRWLFKSDPDTYSFADLKRDGRTVWDGVSNPVALKHLRCVLRGDAILIYHTGKEKAVVGMASAASDSYPDPKQPASKLVVVDIAAGARLARPVALATLKQRGDLGNLDLVRLPRLSVMPVSESQWKVILSLAKA